MCADPPRSKSAIPGEKAVGYEDRAGLSPKKAKMGLGRAANLLKRAGKEAGTEVCEPVEIETLAHRCARLRSTTR